MALISTGVTEQLPKSAFIFPFFYKSGTALSWAVERASSIIGLVPSPIQEDVPRTMDLNNMIEDLEQMQQQDDVRRREKAKARRMAISSHHTVLPITTNRYATQ
ncbi:Uncharacterized protein Fot_35619 [Forsythia ovata]|uniref:Uncharacterized protein n=1 Tax=Forsythia ovata TaxID=205694 RepID=A0ABD1SM16_9LAMI